jgi:hypothetical protein
VAVAFLLLVCAAALGLVNAQGPRAPDPSPQDPNPQETAAVRVLRLGGSAATVDVWIGDAQAITGLEPMVVSEYVEVPSGERAVAVRPSGEDDAGDALTPIGHVALEPGGYATLLTFDRDAGAAGGVDESPSSAPPPLVRIVDPLDRLPPVGHAGVRLVHAAPGVPGGGNEQLIVLGCCVQIGRHVDPARRLVLEGTRKITSSATGRGGDAPTVRCLAWPPELCALPTDSCDVSRSRRS